VSPFFPWQLNLGEEKMAFCGKCGAQLHENATFCAACGTPTAVQAQTPVTAAAAAPAPARAATPVHLEESRGFFSWRFDFSFTSFVTGKLIKVLYVLAMIVLVVALVVVVIAAQTQPSPMPIVAIVAAPIVFFLYLILVRVQLEILIVIFRMSEHLAEIAQQGRR
jgi:ribosomal protein L37E